MALPQVLYVFSNLKGAQYSANLNAPTKEQTSQAGADFYAITVNKTMEYAPIDASKVKAPKVTDFKSLTVQLSALKQKQLDELTAGAVTLKLEKPTDESALKKYEERQKALAELSSIALISTMFNSAFQLPLPKAAKPPKNEVRLAASLLDWQIVKKVNLDTAETKEIFSALVSMNAALDAKIPSLICNNAEGYEQMLDKTLAPLPERRNLTRLQQFLQSENYDSTKKQLATFTTTAQLPMLLHHYYAKIFARCGFNPHISTELMSAVYPELKIPKPKGNFGSKKKK